MGKYVLRWDKDSDTYMSNIGYLDGTSYLAISWGSDVEKDKAMTYDTLEEAKNIVEDVNKAVARTYWDFEDIPPQPVIEEL